MPGTCAIILKMEANEVTEQILKILTKLDNQQEKLLDEFDNFKQNQLAFNGEMRHFQKEQLAFNDEMRHFQKEQLAFNENQRKFNNQQTKFNQTFEAFQQNTENRLERMEKRLNGVGYLLEHSTAERLEDKKRADTVHDFLMSKMVSLEQEVFSLKKNYL